MRFSNEPHQPQDHLRRAGDRSAAGHLAVLRIALKDRPAWAKARSIAGAGGLNSDGAGVADFDRTSAEIDESPRRIRNCDHDSGMLAAAGRIF